MRWPHGMSEYLSFSRKEKIGILTIVLLIVLIWIFPQVIKSSSHEISLGDTSWIGTLNRNENDSGSLSGAGEDRNERTYHQTLKKPSKERERTVFYFDPNTLSEDGWKKLGIRQRTISIIHNYLSKGGHFEKADDLKRIYGIHPDELAALTPYIQIKTATQTRFSGNSNFDKRPQMFEKPKHDLVEINAADTAAFIALPGIGSKLATRIINFRDKLGGFYSIDQVGETYGLADSTFEKIKPWLKLENIGLRKININTATKEEMKSHPYLRWTLANAIVEYRSQHGKYSAVEDLKKVSAVTEEIFEKVKPYISVE